MGCACNKKRQATGYGTVQRPAAREPEVKQPQTYSLRKPNGQVQTFGSKLEALAARAREGGKLIN